MGCKRCIMLFLMLQEGHEMANQRAPGGMRLHSSGVKHFLKEVKKLTNFNGLRNLTTEHQVS